MSAKTDAMLKEIRAYGLTYPGAHLKSPWPDHLDLAVKDKTFAYLSLEGQPIGVGVKLPISNEKALMLPGAQPTGYGLGKSGWVSVQFADGEVPPLDLIKDWLEESYRAQAPKSLIKELDAKRGGASTATPPKKAAKKTAKKSAKKTAKKSAKKR